MKSKIIESSKINNIRDLGGTETKNGNILKNNLFIRCAVPLNIGKIEHENLMELDPAAIIDFRGIEEAKKNPPDLTKELEKKRVHLPIEPKVWSALNLLNDTNSLNDKTFQETLKQAYAQYTTDNLEVYKEFLRIAFKNVGKPICNLVSRVTKLGADDCYSPVKRKNFLEIKHDHENNHICTIHQLGKTDIVGLSYYEESNTFPNTYLGLDRPGSTQTVRGIFNLATSLTKPLKTLKPSLYSTS